MDLCELEYIPNRIHTLDKPINNVFYIGEQIYKRCNIEELDNPFKTISICELSHNRSGKNNEISLPDDVLFNIKATDGFQKYEKEVCILEIKDLVNNKYSKEFPNSNNKQIYNTQNKALIELIHEPEPCMYPHCVFRVHFNGNIVDFSNYRSTVGKDSVIRTLLKNELASMIIRREIVSS